MTPPAKFCNVPLNAIPTAIPADANNATNEEVLTPRIPMTITSNINISDMLIRLRRKVRNESSTFLRIKMPETNFLIFFINHFPTQNMTKAISIFIEICIIPLTICSNNCCRDILEALESFSKKETTLVVSAGVGTVVGRPPLMSKSSIIVVFLSLTFAKLI